MFHCFPNRRTGFDRRVQTGSWIYLVSQFRYSLALLDHFEQMGQGFLTVWIGWGQGLHNCFRMSAGFTAMMDDRFGIPHSPMRDHILRIFHHGRTLCLNFFHRRTHHALYRK